MEGGRPPFRHAWIVLRPTRRHGEPDALSLTPRSPLVYQDDDDRGEPTAASNGIGCTMATRFPSFEDLLAGGRFLSKLPSFLRHPMGLEEARTTLRRRFEHRETDFLALARFAIYDNPRSPYRELLALSGCEPEDLERLVRRDGVESALVELYRRGVYLSVDEFKGRSPIV